MIEQLVSFGGVFPASALVELLRPYRMFILPGFFIGFFAVAFIAIALGRRLYARTAFIAFFFALLLVFNFVAPTALFPFVAWAQFSTPMSETAHHNEIRIVDENGKELKIDNRATLTFDGISIGSLTDKMVETYDDEQNEAVARHLLRESTAYRDELHTRSSARYLRFPHHGLTSSWTPEILREYDEFVGVRIYEMTFVTSSDGTEIEEYDEEMRLEIFPNGTAPDAQRTSNTSPPDSINRTAPSAIKGVAE